MTEQYLLASETELPDWNTGDLPDFEEPLALHSMYDAAGVTTDRDKCGR